MDALQYKVKYDPHYKDVSIDYNNLNQIPEERTDVSSMLHTIEANNNVMVTNSEDVDEDQVEGTVTNSSSFIFHLPNEHRELQIIKKTLELEDTTDNIVDWPEIGLTPINEYNTEGLLDMAFPTLFPNGIGLQIQPRTREIKMHEYVLHLMRFHDQRFGQHPRFRYYIYNLMMRHRSQSLATVFMKKNAEEHLPTTIESLRTHQKELPDSQLVAELLHFGFTMRGTKPYWNKCRLELTNMINQIGSPALFFTLSAANTKWPGLQQLLTNNMELSMRSNKHRLENVINNPHITSLYLQQRFTIFREEVIEKLLGVTDMNGNTEEPHTFMGSCGSKMRQTWTT
ncbi:uncharacterized protein LOC131039077 isoform X1 [Cryptomeria japonica]|uniref:uncharacterized protein LOC131039077 isoform X1 n=1 Tax=Cryptomeria japonica TaxID=3369 RepID=UPI0027DA44FC|nr:uncharacterized protein LOC131039077 isoform X1 [Cryptomeria japonica]XP_057827705.2 uncharacterized protein LOC131039077 isoform X1 [Cryptomeria japonica]XP_057827707.2 uncharacterized protein LOC131039077 isoform X1 [Cryptomeria japonica]